MAVTKTILIDGKAVEVRASALVPRLYRAKFGRDMVHDLQLLEANVKAAKADMKEGSQSSLTIDDLTLFENIAWLLAKHADPAVPSDPDEWLDSFDGVLSIYEVLPEILALWGRNMAQTSTPAKK